MLLFGMVMLFLVVMVMLFLVVMTFFLGAIVPIFFIGGKRGNAFARVDDRQISIPGIFDHVIQKKLHLQAILHQHVGLGNRLSIARFGLILVGPNIGGK